MAAGTTNFPTNLDSNSVATNATEITSTGYNNHSVQIEALEAKVGKDSSAVTTSHDYKLSGVTGSDKAVSKTGTETLTNKTLTSPTITGAVITPELLVAGTGTTYVQQTFSPNFTGLTVGSAGVTTARYIQIGKEVFGYLAFTLASGSPNSAVTGEVSFTLPVAPRSMLNVTIIGQVNILDAGTNNYGGVFVTTGGPTCAIRYENVSGSTFSHAVFSSTLPFTWTTNDAFHGIFHYEAA